MFAVGRKSIKRVGIIAGATALVMSLIPGQAFAIDRVDCTGSDFLQIWWHDGIGSYTTCYANAGTTTMADAYVWIDKVSTGNNDVSLHDVNGTDVYISRWNIVTYPNRPKGVDRMTIL
ncbi:beta/gamma crystallin domain-containing protein [Actinoallomurus rhizosphaericola]|uniref:beta/gamma crystallin domain-containing protein n=1 Tax=Actinoallomurus rhizosphaericola TaxID=2952536 RepID=UPI0020936968|nr:beta/gamma crystallin domain-containing protein [Actinoallomurus rhizosphaericola]MCO5995025.1 hypothetical protein [Actinoallomurus rhizosphaericola]